MKTIPINNAKLISMLDASAESIIKFSEERGTNYLDPVVTSDKYPELNAHHPCSVEYLDEAIKLEEARTEMFYFALHSNNFDYTNMINVFNHMPVNDIKEFFRPTIRKNYLRILRYINAQRSSLSAYYPPEGFLGWHHNSNAPGRNILFTWSETGEGNFKYRDKDTGEVVTVQDVKGWQCKMGNYPQRAGNKTKELFWHSAYSKCRRVSLAFVVDDEVSWNHAMEVVRGSL